MATGKKDITKKLNQITRRISKLDLTDEKLTQFTDEIERVISEFSKQFKEEIDQKITDISTHFSKLKLSIPSNILKLTPNEIINAGGSYDVDPETGEIVFNIPKNLFVSDFKITNMVKAAVEKEASSRNVLTDLSFIKNKVQGSVMKSKRARPIVTPSHSMTTRKKVARMTTCSPSELDNTMIYSNTRAFATSSKPVASRGGRVTNTLKPSSSVKAPTLLQREMVKSTPKSHPHTTSFIRTHEKGTCPSNSVRLTLVNPKTPGGQNRLFKKQPRAARDGEVILHCSTAGTPLLTKQQANK